MFPAESAMDRAAMVLLTGMPSSPVSARLLSFKSDLLMKFEPSKLQAVLRHQPFQYGSINSRNLP
jgi:hypothetical protein